MQKLHTVSFYTPPELGDVMDGKHRRAAPELLDAGMIEDAWRKMHPPEKLLLKLHYITYQHIRYMPERASKVRPALKKQHGIQIRSADEYIIYQRKVLNALSRQLQRNINR